MTLPRLSGGSFYDRHPVYGDAKLLVRTVAKISALRMQEEVGMRECERQEPSKLRRGSSPHFRQNCPSRDRLAPLLKPAHHYKGAGAHNLHLRLYQNEPMSYSSGYLHHNNNPYNNPRGRPQDVWDGAVLRIVPMISSANRKIGRKALLITCYKPQLPRNSRRGLRTCTVAARVNSLDFLAVALSLAPLPPSCFQAGRPAQLQVLRTLPMNLRQVQVTSPAPSHPSSSHTDLPTPSSTVPPSLNFFQLSRQSLPHRKRTLPISISASSSIITTL